jgi:spore coat polysaccharide biosynthesis predicted glycosyltransferase SpsG
MGMGRLVAVADAMPDAGLGHLTRSSAVVAALRARGATVECVGHGARAARTVDGVRWTPGALPRGVPLLVDSYTLDPAAVEGRCAWFDDGGRGVPSRAEVLISPAGEADGDRRRLHGLAWSCVRPVFWGEPAVPVPDAVDRVLVASGGGDPRGAAARLSAAVREALPRARVRVVVGPLAGAAPEGVEPVVAPPDLAGEIRAAGIVVCLAGQTALEAACLGVPAVVVAAVENQRPNADRLAAAGAAVSVALDGPLGEEIGALAADRARREAMAAAARTAVDGFGALRVAAVIDRRLLRGE